MRLEDVRNSLFEIHKNITKSGFDKNGKPLLVYYVQIKLINKNPMLPVCTPDIFMDEENGRYKLFLKTKQVDLRVPINDIEYIRVNYKEYVDQSEVKQVSKINMPDFFNNMSPINKALIIASYAHNNQKDKSGGNYIWHPVTVTRSKLLRTEEEQIVAILHDVVEDTYITLYDLTEHFNDTIVEALKLLTHSKYVSYENYIQNIINSKNRIALSVKLSDLEHNIDLTRIPHPTEKDIQRIEKYKKYYDLLMQERKKYD